jgi:hypothetical protein
VFAAVFCLNDPSFAFCGTFVSLLLRRRKTPRPGRPAETMKLVTRPSRSRRSTGQRLILSGRHWQPSMTGTMRPLGGFLRRSDGKMSLKLSRTHWPPSIARITYPSRYLLVVSDCGQLAPEGRTTVQQLDSEKNTKGDYHIDIEGTDRDVPKALHALRKHDEAAVGHEQPEAAKSDHCSERRDQRVDSQTNNDRRVDASKSDASRR